MCWPVPSQFCTSQLGNQSINQSKAGFRTWGCSQTPWCALRLAIRFQIPSFLSLPTEDDEDVPQVPFGGGKRPQMRKERSSNSLGCPPNPKFGAWLLGGRIFTGSLPNWMGCFANVKLRDYRDSWFDAFFQVCTRFLDLFEYRSRTDPECKLMENRLAGHTCLFDKIMSL